MARIYTTMRGRTLKTPRIPGLFEANAMERAAETPDEKERETENRNAISIFSLLPFPSSSRLTLFSPSPLSPNLFHFGFEVRVVWVTERDRRQRHGLTRTSCNLTKPKPSIAFFVFHLFFSPPLPSFSFRLATERGRHTLRSVWLDISNTHDTRHIVALRLSLFLLPSLLFSDYGVMAAATLPNYLT